MTARDICMASAGAAEKLYVDDVFSTYLYAGNGSTQTITNGIDLAGEGGLVWIKQRNQAVNHRLFDTNRGVGNSLVSNSTAGTSFFSGYLNAFNSDGFGVGTANDVNENGYPLVSWTFRKAPKFFDVVTYTGNGANRTISHALGTAPGMIAVKRTDSTGDWQVYHRSILNTEYLVLNSTAAKATGATRWNSTTATDSVFSLGTDATVNASGGTYVAYLFAHDTDPDGMIQCGSFTTDGSGNATVNLGWEPQFVMYKQSTASGGDTGWNMLDTMRGWVNPGGSAADDAALFTNTSAAEVLSQKGFPTSTGFQGITAFGISATYIYIAIRRPNKPPTSGAEVYNAIARTGTGAAATVTGVGFAPDAAWSKSKSVTGSGVFDRLRGANMQMVFTGVFSEADLGPPTNALTGFDVMDGVKVGADSTQGGINLNTINYINWFFRRAPGFFDVVCYTGNGVNGRPLEHSLDVAPQLVVVKRRDAGTTPWRVLETLTPSLLQLNATNSGNTSDAALGAYFGNGSSYAGYNPTSTLFYVANNSDVNGSAQTYVAYLFASLPGISKVGSYTGNGSSQTVNCGFSSGARFVLIKRRDSTGDWFVWDTARGIVAANDPHLSLNTTAAEVTSDDSVDPDSSGFIVNQVAATNINVNSATYIYLAIA